MTVYRVDNANLVPNGDAAPGGNDVVNAAINMGVSCLTAKARKVCSPHCKKQSTAINFPRS